MLFRLYQMLLVYTPFKVGPSRPAWDRGREQRRSSKPDWMNSGSSISINKEVDQGNKRWFSDCSRRGKFLSTNKHDHTSLHPCRKVPHCWIFFCKKLRKRALHYDRCCLCSVCACVAEPRPQSNRHRLAALYGRLRANQGDSDINRSLCLESRPHAPLAVIGCWIQTTIWRLTPRKYPGPN